MTFAELLRESLHRHRFGTGRRSWKQVSRSWVRRFGLLPPFGRPADGLSVPGEKW
jgi:hypothetical protein